ncbi:MAG: septum site-determining protein MinC [Gammaproteobacteria bacterium]|nr:MAG: septum site-determining protein MinC [Gammaproteobacteria bacterium]
MTEVIDKEVKEAVNQSFQIKGGMVTLMVLELLYIDYRRFAQELQKKVASAPNLFNETPIIISLEKLDHPSEYLDFERLIEICRSNDLVPIAVRGGTEGQSQQAQVLGLGKIPSATKSSGKSAQEQLLRDTSARSINESVETSAANSETLTLETTPKFQSTKIVRQPVRSGQRVYARGGDLIVLASVGDGAEVLADGNIHIYGSLRGRAIAGIEDKDNAHIFCQSLEASLVSIGGVYMLDEDMRANHWKDSVHIHLDNENLHIEKL